MKEFLSPTSKEIKAQFKLMGVIHKGGSINSGHYWFCYRCHNGNSEWILFNDIRVTKATNEQVKTRTANILIYEQI